MSISEYEIKNSKKQLDFYKELCEVKDKKIEDLQQRIDKCIDHLETHWIVETREQINVQGIHILKGDNNDN